MRGSRPRPTDPALERLNAADARRLLAVALGIMALPTGLAAVVHLLLGMPGETTAFFASVTAGQVLLLVAVPRAPQRLLGPIAATTGILTVVLIVGAMAMAPLLDNRFTVGFMGLVPIAIVVTARWGLRLHLAWLAVTTAVLLAIVGLDAGYGALPSLTSQVVAGWLAGSLFSVLLQQAQERERRAAVAAARTAHVRRTRAARALRRLQAVESIGRLLSEQGPIPRALDAAMRLLRDEFGYAYPSIYLGDDQVVRLGAHLDYETPITEFSRERGVVGRTMRTKATVLIPDVAAEPAYVNAQAAVVSELCVPLLAGDRFLGVINVESTVRLDADDLASVSILADRFAAAIDLAERRDTLQVVLDASPLAITAGGADGLVHYWNQAATALFGWTAEEVIGQPAPMIVHGPPGVREVQARVARGERVTGLEGERPHRDGHMVPVRIFAAPFGDRAPYGAIVVHQDLTPERAASAALTESEARFETVVGALEEGVVVQDTTMQIIWSNAATGRLLGLSPAELDGTAPFPAVWGATEEDGTPLVPSEYPGAVVARTGQAAPRQTIGVRRPDGSVAWMEAQAVPLHRDPGDPPYAVVTSFIDVTDRKRQEDELRRAERQVSAVLEQAPNPVIGMGGDGRITFANVRACEMFGYEPDELIGRSLEILVPEGLSEGHVRLREAYLLHPVPRPMGIGMVLSGRRRDGTTLPVEIAINPVETPAGREVYATIVDLSERRRIEAELLQAAKMDSVGRLAGGIAHDFNNLLTAIIGYGHIATTELPPTMSVRADVEEMVKAAERAADLTRQLLGFARKTVLAPASHNLNVILDGLEPFLRRLIGEPVALVTNLDRSIGHIRVDRAQIDQILVNLAVNARDAMPDGGTLVVETSSLLGEDMDSVLEVSGDRIVMLSFSDTGTGMSEEVRLHAFEPFYTTKPFGQGTGLGLATTYGIVRQSGGAITIDSAPDAGTTFRIYFPEVVASEDREAPAPRRVAEVTARHTVLVVEDEESVRTLVVRMLERAGYRVLQAPNGAAAMSLVGTRLSEIDLLLTDIVMPGMRGPDLFDVLRTARPDLRAVFMSGYPAEDESVAGVRAGGNGPEAARPARRVPILAKPFTAEELVSAVAEGMAGPPVE